MCGIAGIIQKKTAKACLTEQITAMTDVIKHRGPDGEGWFSEQGIALGHRRLSIIDLSEDGRQPMQYANGRLVITFNGEIYNYLELRSELEKRGHIFRSHTDTEVILASYAEWGEACVQRFNGMWAFALLDRKQRQIFCSRDRFGVKPLYFIDHTGVFAFSSEIRQLLPFLDRIQANHELLQDFILTKIADHTDDTFFAGVRKVPPAHNLVYDLDEHRYEVRCYYRIPYREDIARLSAEDATKCYISILEDAVRLRLRSDVPVGTCLSGGLDSSSIATLAADRYSDTAGGAAFTAITAISEQESTNEADYAKQVVEASRMHWLTPKPDYDDFVASLPTVVSAQEEPFGSPSLIMQYAVMRTARQNRIPVLLDGQGGDETLLGYEKYYASYLATTLRREGLGTFMAALQATRTNNAKLGLFNVMKYLAGSLVWPARYGFYRFQHDYLSPMPTCPVHLKSFAQRCTDAFELQVLEMTSTNLPVLLRYEDKNSMANSIETRLPFLDYRAVEVALSLPGEYKIRNGWSKWVLRHGMSGHMPDAIVWRRNKFGFESPEDLWLARHSSEMKRAVSNSSLLASLTKKERLIDKYDRLDKRSQWRLYSIALWESAFGVEA